VLDPQGSPFSRTAQAVEPDSSSVAAVGTSWEEKVLRLTRTDWLPGRDFQV
jgi:hypothetical protein